MPSVRSLWRRLLPTGPSRGYNRCVWRPMRDISVVPEPQGQGKVAILVAISVSTVLLSILPRLNGWKAGHTELGGLHHHRRRMILTGGKRSSAVLAACEKRRSGLAPSTTQGPGTKLRAQFSECPTIRIPGQLPYRPWPCGRSLPACWNAVEGRGLAFGKQAK